MNKLVLIIPFIFCLIVSGCASRQYITTDGDIITLKYEGGVNDNLVKHINKLHKQIYIDKKIREIKLNINSPGGNTRSLQLVLARMDKWKHKGIKVTVIVDRFCMSACTVIFANGDERITASDALWMFHSPYFGYPEFNPETDRNIIGIPRKYMIDTIERNRRTMFEMYHRVSPKFAIFLKDNIIWRYGPEFRENGITLFTFADGYITSLLPKKK